MTRNHTHLLAAVLTLVLAAPALAQVPAAIANAPGTERYPTEDGLIVQQLDRFTLAADGTLQRHHEQALKMFTAYLTRHDYFDPVIDWNDARATMRVDQARTYMADGTVVDAAANSLVPNTSAAFNHAVPYAHMRQMVVAHVGVEHGATSVTAYTLDDREPSGVPLWGVLDLQTFVPIAEHQVTIELPDGTPLHHAGLFCDVAPVESSAGGQTSYRFQRSGVAAVNLDEAGHHGHGVARLVYSTAADWAAARAYLEGRVDPALEASQAVKDKTAEVIGDATLPPEQIAAIHTFVVDGVQAVHWPVDDFDYAARAAGDVLDSSIGHELDKAVLLASMLRHAGFDATVVLVSGSSVIAEEVPAPAQLEQVWVRVQTGDHEAYLHPDASCDRRNKFDLAGRWVLPLDGKATAPAQRPTPPAGANRASLRAEVTLEDGGHELTLSGTADLDLALRYNPVVTYDRDADRTGKLAKQVAGTFGGARPEKTVVARQTCKLTSLRTTFAGGAVAVPRHGLVRLALPRVPGALTGASFQVHRNARTMPLALSGPATERVELVIELPDGYDLAYRPEATSLKNEVGSIERTVEVEEGTLTVTTELRLTTDLVSPAQYRQLRALFDRLEGDSDDTILLQRQD